MTNFDFLNIFLVWLPFMNGFYSTIAHKQCFKSKKDPLKSVLPAGVDVNLMKNNEEQYEWATS